MSVTAISLIDGPSNTRDLFVEKIEVLEKVKALALLPDGEHMTLRQVSDYYEVDIEVVRKVVQRHRNELQSDGMQMLKGAKLDRFKASLQVVVPELKKVPSTQLLPRRAILRLGMVLRNSTVAEKIRTYLLDIEEQVGDEEKKVVFEGKWTEDIEEIVLQTVAENEDKGIRFNDTLQQLSEEIGASVYQIKNYWYVGGHGNEPLRNKLDAAMKIQIASRSNRSKLSQKDNVIDLFSVSAVPQKEGSIGSNHSSLEEKQTVSLEDMGADELRKLASEQIEYNNRLFSEMQSFQQVSIQLVNSMESLRVAVVGTINHQTQIYQDFQAVKQEISEIKEIVDIRNQKEYQEIERHSIKLHDELKESHEEIADMQKDMNEVLRKAGLSLLTGMNDDGLSFQMDQNGNLERFKK